MAMTQLSEQFESILNEEVARRVDSQVREGLADLALKLEDVGWSRIMDSFDGDSGLSLQQLKVLEETLSDMVEGNPLMRRGTQLRYGYVFGKGIVYTNVKPAAQRVIDAPHNKRALFSVQAYEELNKAKMTAGNVFVLYDTKEKRFTRVPLRQITGVVTREDDAEEILYLQRTWKANGTEISRWFPLHTNKSTKTSVGDSDVKVDTSKVFYHETTNKQIGWTFGVPDGLAAMSWVMAYSEYLKNNSTLVAAYSRFAFKVTRATKAGVADAGMQLRTPDGAVGATAVSTGQNTLTPVSPTGSQVDFDNGQPLAAMVAAALGVSVIALLSSPGAAAGSYGAAQTLDAPTLIGMQAIQDTWALFFQNILRDLDSKNADVEFPAIETDPTYRLLGLVAQLLAAGILHQEEARGLSLDLLDVRDPKTSVPEPMWYNLGKSVWEAENNVNQEPGGDGFQDPNPRQGNTGLNGSATQGDTNNDGRTDTIGAE